VTVPALDGLSEGQAEAVLQGDGLIAAPTIIPNCEAGSDGQVVQQSPDAGVKIHEGDTVDLGVCQPPTPSPT
jgi:beta-lactam-binding protein with PASTA domain